MHGGAGLLVDILENGIDPGVMVLLRAVPGGIKARPLGPLSLRWDGGGINTGGEPSPQRRSAEAAFEGKTGSARATATMDGGWPGVSGYLVPDRRRLL
jgi:hypothetical protein